MKRSKAPQAKTSPRAIGKWGRWAAIALAALLIIPVLQAALLRWIDPPFTSLMCFRKAEALIAGRKHTNRYQWVDYQKIPRDFLTCALIAEDQRFFQHSGFDWTELKAAKRQAERTGKQIRGTSTITMQCARSVFLWQGRSWIRKGLEAYYTYWMELFLPKRRILEIYANSVELGPGIFGVHAAAQSHYGLSIDKLSRDQCIRLAALLPAPLTWDPHKPSPRYSRRIQRLQRSFPKTRIPGWSGS